MIKRLGLATASVAFVCAGLLGKVAFAADSYPERAVTVYVGFAPGGATDLLARYYADQLSQELGKAFVVENRAGAGGNLAIQLLTHAEPDGYTIAMGANYIASNAALGRNQYDWESELDPIALIAATPNILVLPPDTKFDSVEEIIQAGKEEDSFLTFGSAGVGSSIHLSGELFKVMTGIDMTHVPYKGVTPAELALMGGEVDMMFGSPSNEVPLVESGKLKALAITGLERMAALPDVPTLDELGLTGFNVGASYVLVAPAGVPQDVIDTLERAVENINSQDKTIEFTNRLYASPLRGGPNKARDFLKQENEKWVNVVKETGLTIDE